MYGKLYSEELTRKLAKLKKRDPEQYNKVRKKIDKIALEPDHQYKYLHYTMKNILRVHIGHFVLIFNVDHVNKAVSFEDYDHHDKIYK